MAKRKRTREQKKLADLRHKLPQKMDNSVIPETQDEAIPTQNYTFTYNPVTRTQPQSKAATFNTPHAFLLKDLRKTAILTVSIIFAQVILYFIVNTL